MRNGLLDPTVLSFVFAPLLVTLTLLLGLWRRRVPDDLSTNDGPERLLASVVGQMPDERREWGTAMLAELGEVHSMLARWRFALGCIRVALFPPRRTGLLQYAVVGQSPVCGMLAVALPPLGLPFIYFAAVLVETIGGSPFTQASSWSNPDIVIIGVKAILVLTLCCLLAGLPLGFGGLLRRERLRWLSVLGIFLSTGIIGYFLVVMSFLAGGPNGD
jgi:hypothetical protein